MNYTNDSLEKLRAKGQSNYNSVKKMIPRLAKMSPQKLDGLMLQLHEDEFNKIDCLQCANCCKTISPAMNESDVRRMAASMKLKIGDFYARFLEMDSEGDYVFRQSPCPFLGSDNFCSIYESRPRACYEYPHTNRKRFYQVLDITLKNYKVCPAVFNILEQLRQGSDSK
jgi:Fe-S-cluster containining protein